MCPMQRVRLAVLFPTAVRKLTCLAPVLSLALLAGFAQASERLAIPEQHPGGPYYVRVLAYVGYTDTVAIIFYRDNVPEDVNLVFDPDLDPDESPFLLEGFAIWENGADPSADAPYQQQLHDVQGTPVSIWFASATDVIAAVGDGKLTVGELEEMPSLQKGLADSYHETLHPYFSSGGAKIPKVNIVATGALEDGRSFFMLWENTNSSFNATTETILRIGE